MEAAFAVWPLSAEYSEGTTIRRPIEAATKSGTAIEADEAERSSRAQGDEGLRLPSSAEGGVENRRDPGESDVG